VTRELTDKITTLEQMLQGTNRSKRGILSIVGKTFKFLFGTVLSDDIVRLDQKVDELKTQQGNLLHYVLIYVSNQIAVTRDLDDNIKNNAKRLTTLISTN
jgi:hypothetical protein